MKQGTYSGRQVTFTKGSCQILTFLERGSEPSSKGVSSTFCKAGLHTGSVSTFVTGRLNGV